VVHREVTSVPLGDDEFRRLKLEGREDPIYLSLLSPHSAKGRGYEHIDTIPLSGMDSPRIYVYQY
jgi:hypothetical protein